MTDKKNTGAGEPILTMIAKSLDHSDDERILKEEWTKVKEILNYPAIADPEFCDVSETLMGTAQFEWEGRKTRIGRQFVDELEQDGRPRDKAIVGILEHETGHYVRFPRELATSLYLQSEGEQWFKEKNALIWPWYADLCDEAGVLSGADNAGVEMLENRKTFSRTDNVKGKTLNDLLLALYADRFNLPLPDVSEDVKRRAKILKGMRFINLSMPEHASGYYLFGKTIEDLVAPDQKKQCSQQPFGQPAPPSKELDRALSQILQELGPKYFRQASKFLAKKIPGFQDSFDKGPREERPLAGLDRADFKRHDECIPMYDRMASLHGLYIAKRPMETDAASHVRAGIKDYEVGDPLHRIDIFGSRGFIGIPGLSKVFQEEEAFSPARGWRIPDANIGIDSSGSMDPPDSDQGCIQTLAAFVLARNYWANGSKVGGWNFSTDLIYLSPSRDLHPFKQLMCGYWGGGTVLNKDKLLEYMKKMSPHIQVTSEKDYDRMLAGMSKEERRSVTDKHLDVKGPDVRRKLERLDNILITDGGIANMSDLLEHLLTLGEVSRNILFVTNKASYDTWVSTIHVPNTYFYLAEKKEDLLRLAIGQARSLTRGAA